MYIPLTWFWLGVAVVPRAPHPHLQPSRRSTSLLIASVHRRHALPAAAVERGERASAVVAAVFALGASPVGGEIGRGVVCVSALQK